MKLSLRSSLLLTIVFINLCHKSRAQTFNAFTQQDVVNVSGISTDAQIDALNASQRQTHFVYFDGLGRAIQSVSGKASPSQNDIVQPVSFNSLGQQTISYLPYVSNNGSGTLRLNAITEQQAFYANGTSDKIADDSNPYSQQVFENSPLQRVLSAGTTGTGFQPVSGQHFKVLSYRSNLSSDGSIINWAPDGTNAGSYANNALSVAEGTDEDGRKVTTFTDYAGRVVLKRQLANTVIGGVTVTNFDTYYIYNNAGMVA